MTDDVIVDAAGAPRPLPRPGPPRPKRARPASDLVATLEHRSPESTAAAGLSSAAIRAGDLVRGMRRGAGLSQAGLAERIGVSQARVAEIEAGAGVHGPTWDVMERVAGACGERVGIAGRRPGPATVRDDGVFEALRRAMQRTSMQLPVSSGGWLSVQVATALAAVLPPGPAVGAASAADFLASAKLRGFGRLGEHLLVEAEFATSVGAAPARMVLEPIAIAGSRDTIEEYMARMAQWPIVG